MLTISLSFISILKYYASYLLFLMNRMIIFVRVNQYNLIMKQHFQKLKKCCGISSLLLLMGLIVSCNKDEDIATLLNPQTICGSYYNGEGISVGWNGKEVSNISFELSPVEGDSTKLKLELFNAIPLNNGVEVLVDVIPGETEISFSGILKNYSYELQVEGIYMNHSLEDLKSTEKQSKIDLQCRYKAHGDLDIDKPYIFRFDKNCMYWQAGTSGPVEWDGHTYSATDFVQTVLEHISARIAKEVSAMQFVFHDDASVDISVCRAGNTDFTPWMTVLYWYGEYSNSMYLEFTGEQVKMFYDMWLGTPNESYTPPFRMWGERNLLPMIYWAGERLGWSIANPNRYYALEMYTKGKGLEGLTEKEKQELLLFEKCLNNVDDHNHWMSWCITMNSERIR